MKQFIPNVFLLFELMLYQRTSVDRQLGKFDVMFGT